MKQLSIRDSEGIIVVILEIPTEMCTKKGKQSTSHRYNLLPLLRSGPGGVQRELVV